MQKFIPYILLFLVNLIYGLNFSIAKFVLPNFIKPLGLVTLRTLFATIFFWIIAYSTNAKQDKLDKKDIPRFIALAIFGMALNQLFFLQGLEFTTHINGAIIMTSSPIVTLLFSYFLLNKKIYKTQIIGILIGMLGAIGLILYGKQSVSLNASYPLLGNIFILLNAISFSYFMIISIPLMNKYHIYTILKWAFTFGFLINLPFGFNQIIDIKWHTFNMKIWFSLFYILFFVSCITYLFNQYALKKVSPTKVSIFVFTQPIFAVITSLLLKTDSMDFFKCIFGGLIFIGVYFVIKKSDN